MTAYQKVTEALGNDIFFEDSKPNGEALRVSAVLVCDVSIQSASQYAAIPTDCL